MSLKLIFLEDKNVKIITSFTPIILESQAFYNANTVAKFQMTTIPQSQDIVKKKESQGHVYQV